MAYKFQKPVAQKKPLAHREGDVCEYPGVRAKHPVYGWGWFAADPDGPNYDRPVNWVEEDPDDADHKSGSWVFAKDCD